jgi:hypothetical protein
MKSTPKTIKNGVNVSKLFETIDAIKGNQNIAKFKFQAKNKWKLGGKNQTVVNEFYGACRTHSRDKPFVFLKDEPPVLLGDDAGANPVEYALAALAGCLTTALFIMHPHEESKLMRSSQPWKVTWIYVDFLACQKRSETDTRASMWISGSNPMLQKVSWKN